MSSSRPAPENRPSGPPQKRSGGKVSPIYRLMTPQPARIMHVRRMTDMEKLFTIALDDETERERFRFAPGQFVEVGVPGYGEAPLSICSSPEQWGTFDICVRSAGVLTGALHHLAEGETITIRGPYGNGYPVGQMKGRDMLFVAGGIGLAPLMSFIRYIALNRRQFDRISLLYGARSPSDILFADDLEHLDMHDFRVEITVDHPDEKWRGHAGRVTHLFPMIDIGPNTTAAVTGPPVMYGPVAHGLLMRGVPPTQIFFSLERNMKCGVGKCNHCLVGNRYVCTDGPVFNYWQMSNLLESI